jgi:hypothetical protein
LDAAPKGHIILDTASGLGWRWVKPGGVIVLLAFHPDDVVASHPFPGANRMRIALGEIFAIDRIGREIVVALHHDGGVRLC